MTAPTPCPAPVHRLIPFVYVHSVPDTLAFYRLLGFDTVQTMHDPDGTMNWAWAQTKAVVPGRGPAQIMFSRTWRPIVPGAQDIFFYLHCADLPALRDHLLAAGLLESGRYAERTDPNAAPSRRGRIYDVTHPVYMPEGEFRIHDPDGYAILVGQCDWRSAVTGQ